jgi:hypothetical protein
MRPVPGHSGAVAEPSQVVYPPDSTSSYLPLFPGPLISLKPPGQAAHKLCNSPKLKGLPDAGHGFKFQGCLSLLSVDSELLKGKEDISHFSL